MSDPRQLLDDYAAETDFERGDLLDDREHEAPKAFAALRAVLDLHRGDTTPVWPEPGEIEMGERLFCVECSHYEGSDDWPCPTIQAITRALEGS